MKNRLVVGLTGNFGSGKSTARKILKRLGAKKTINSDELAREAFSPRSGCLKKIRSLFQNQMLSRRQIAKEVFASPKKRRALERIIHPYVRRRILDEVKKVKSGIVIVEVPLLFEAKFDRFCDATITMVAGTSNVKRLLRSGFSRSEIKARLKAQLSERKKIGQSDFIIDNRGTKEKLKKRTQIVWQQLQSELK